MPLSVLEICEAGNCMRQTTEIHCCRLLLFPFVCMHAYSHVNHCNTRICQDHKMQKKHFTILFMSIACSTGKLKSTIFHNRNKLQTKMNLNMSKIDVHWLTTKAWMFSVLSRTWFDDAHASNASSSSPSWSIREADSSISTFKSSSSVA